MQEYVMGIYSLTETVPFGVRGGFFFLFANKIEMNIGSVAQNEGEYGSSWVKS